MKNELSQAYVPSEHEPEIMEREAKSGFYAPENLPGEREQVFSMVLPPPNATGTLHMGHAVMLAIEDIMMRYQRMQGKKTMWLPGTDHAAIATQVKVEKILQREEKRSRFDLGREAFLGRVDDFVAGSQATIRKQVREMACSIDWSREAFTLDETRNFAVRTMFKKMYDDGLIYRGHRVINWDPVGKTVISNDELVPKERTSMLYTFTYSKEIPIAIATTRPETKVGDTAIAVHPEDARYKQYIGKTFETEFAGSKLTLKVIGDTDVDPEFGTGALGVTPAHSGIDEAMARRHDVPMIQVIDEDACMTPEAGSLVAGLPVLEAREKIVAWLKENDLLEKEEETTQMVSTAERTGAVIEPLPKLQWFVDVNKSFRFTQSKRAPVEGLSDGQEVSIKSLLQHAVNSGDVKIIPNNFEKLYFHWVDNYRDWCISRQLWYGHRIPAWYKGDEVYVGVEAPEGDGWIQDEDTLDTWFSAGMWTFSTMGWPNADAEDLQQFHPTAVLETGYDILPIWVVRMIFMSLYALGEYPFEYVYLHGLVRDDQGRKMSKSLDNIIDPLDMKEKFGTDATRLSLVIGSSPGNDSKLSEEKIAGFRNFTNKLWNIARFVLMSVDTVRLIETVPEAKTEADAWILSRLSEVTARVTEMLDAPKFQFSPAAEILREFTWSDFADWYLEVAKVQREDAALKESTEAVLQFVLQSLLKMWHPFMPLVTTRLWDEIDRSQMLLVAPWPEPFTCSGGERFSELKELVTTIRNVRATYKVDPAKRVNALITGEGLGLAQEMSDVIRNLARLETLEIAENLEKPDGAASAVAGPFTVFLPLGGMIDVNQERERLTEELKNVTGYVATLEKKLANEGFVTNAPKEAVDKERAKLEDAARKVQALEAQLADLG